MKDNARTFAAGSNYFFPLDGFPAVEPITFAAICRPTAMTIAMAAVGIGGDALNTFGRFLRVNPATDTTHVGYYDQASGGVAGGTIGTAAWYLLVASKNQAATPNVTTARIYDYAAQTWNHYTPGSVGSGAAYTTGKFLIGSARVAPATTFSWVGQVAVAAVFGRALSQSEAQALVSGAQSTKTLWDAQLQAGDHAWDLTSGNVADLIMDWVGGADEAATGGGRNTGVTLYTAAGTVPWDTAVVTTFVDFAPITVSAGSEIAGAGVVSEQVTPSPTSVTFSPVTGSNASPRAVALTGTPGATITVTEAASWLAVAPSSLVLDVNGRGTVQIAPNLAGLAAGSTGSTTITFTPGAGAAATVTASYTILAAPTVGTLTVTPASVPTFVTQQGANPAPQTVVVSGAAGITYTIAESVSWLSVTGAMTRQMPPAGVDLVELRAALSTLAPGSETRTLTVTPQGGSATTVTVSYQIVPLTTPTPDEPPPIDPMRFAMRDRMYARLEPLWDNSSSTVVHASGNTASTGTSTSTSSVAAFDSAVYDTATYG